MGHQVRFFITPEDTMDLEARVVAAENVLMLHSRSPTQAPRPVQSLLHEDDSQRWLFYCLVRTEDLSSVITRHVPAQGYWSIDSIKSPVVEFDCCYFDGRILRIGREYYVDGFYGPEGRWIHKPDAFRKWAKSVLATTKKALRRYGTDYIGKGAEAWLASGTGKLVD